MRAKCRVCGTPLDTNTAYKVVTNNKNAYYCSNEEYEKDKRKKEKVTQDKDRVYRLVCDIISRNEITNTALFSEWKFWNSVADNEKIGRYLDENKEFLYNTIARIENKEFNRIRYLSAILKNNLGDYNPKINDKEFVESKVQDEHYETKFKLKQRRGFDDLEDDCDE